MSQLDDTTKQALRLAAVGALLHNLGKINAKFLDKQVNNADNDYLYQHILGLIAPRVSKLPDDRQSDFDVNKLTASAVLDSNTVQALKTSFNLPKPLDDRNDYTVGDLIEYLGQSEPWYRKVNGKYVIEHTFPRGSRLTHLMNRAHRGASGGEKEDIATAQQPDVAELYLSTPFGYETAALNIYDIDGLLAKIEAEIRKHLLPPKNPLPLNEIVDSIRPLLSQAIADTQRPLNDITVGDIGHTGMAFLLTQAVEWILTGRSIDHDELAQKGAGNTLFWRVLTIHTDSLRYLEEASSLADLRVRQQQLQGTFQKISRELEETLLPVEIYADEQRRLFLFPNLDQHTGAYQFIQHVIANFSIDGLRLTGHLSDPVTNHPDDKNGTYIGDQVLKQLQQTPPYDVDAGIIAASWPKQAPNKQLCTACNLRPQGYGAEQVAAYKHNLTYYQNKAEERNICCICMERRAGVAEKWARDELDKTVWLDEVADSNGRLALIVGQWDIEDVVRSHFYPHVDRSQSKTMWQHTVKFLNSPSPDQHSFTINRQTYTWQAGQSVLTGEEKLTAPLKQTDLTIHKPSLMKITVQDVAVGEQLLLTVEQDLTSAFAVDSQVKCWGQDFRVTETHLLETVNAAGRQKVLSDVLWDATHPFIVQKAIKVNVLKITSHGEGAKNESFARLRRIWQTTRTFWQTALDEKDAKGDPILPTVNHRLEIIPWNRASLDLGHYHAYDLRLTNSVKLGVVWDSGKKRFITCDNLEYLAKPELLGKPVIEFLKEELTLEEPAGYGGKNKKWGNITVERAGEIANSGYTSVIRILAEPRTFMALVPAKRALDVAAAIRAKYEREMGKVRNRLPLHLGIVYFHRRTPLQTTLNAGRRMLKQKTRDEVWTVQGVQKGTLPEGEKRLAKGTREFAQTVTVKLEQQGHALTWRVPAVMGDGKTEDNWYPYVLFHTNKDDGRKPNDRTRVFKGLRPTGNDGTETCWLIHAAELKAGDQIYFRPASLDFQWLDSAGQRFEIAYDENGRRRNHLTRPYLLDELATISKAWTLIAGPEGLTSSQIYALRNLVETKRESWQPAAKNWEKDCQPPVYDETGLVTQEAGMFWRFCRDAVVNANWKKEPTKEEVDQLTDWAVSSLFSDVIQLYMGIMKQKPRREENDKRTK